MARVVRRALHHLQISFICPSKHSRRFGGMRGTCGNNTEGQPLYSAGFFSQAHFAAFFWSTTEVAWDPLNAWTAILKWDSSEIIMSALQPKEGFSIRCLKDVSRK